MAEKVPVVIMPGFFTNLYPPASNLARKLRKTGYDVFLPASFMVSLANIHIQATILSKLVDEALKTSRASKCNLIGISMGGIAAYYYLHNLGGAEKVNKFIAIASPLHGTMAAFWGHMFMWPLTLSLYEISPRSPVIKDLLQKPQLHDVKFYTITGLYDNTAPTYTSQHKYAINIASLPFGHLWLSLALDESILDTVDSILSE